MTKQTEEKITRYAGTFLMESGFKVKFDIADDEWDEGTIFSLQNLEFPFEKGESIWLGEANDIKILVDKIIGWNFYDYEA
jgi:hypothetical protein